MQHFELVPACLLSMNYCPWLGFFLLPNDGFYLRIAGCCSGIFGLLRGLANLDHRCLPSVLLTWPICSGSWQGCPSRFTKLTFGYEGMSGHFLLTLEISDDSSLSLIMLPSGYSGHFRQRPFYSLTEIHSDWTSWFKFGMRRLPIFVGVHNPSIALKDSSTLSEELLVFTSAGEPHGAGG